MADVFGTDDPDLLDAAAGVTDSSDHIYGFGGADTIYGLGGTDFIYPGAEAEDVVAEVGDTGCGIKQVGVIGAENVCHDGALHSRNVVRPAPTRW